MRIRKWMPYFELYIDLPFITIQTDLFYRSCVDRTTTYIGLHIRVWKWEWRSRIYDTDKRSFER